MMVMMVGVGGREVKETPQMRSFLHHSARLHHLVNAATPTHLTGEKEKKMPAGKDFTRTGIDTIAWTLNAMMSGYSRRSHH